VFSRIKSRDFAVKIKDVLSTTFYRLIVTEIFSSDSFISTSSSPNLGSHHSSSTKSGTVVQTKLDRSIVINTRGQGGIKYEVKKQTVTRPRYGA
jgi:hypothetical protein